MWFDLLRQLETIHTGPIIEEKLKCCAVAAWHRNFNMTTDSSGGLPFTEVTT